jgi:outer membrane protein assembly factor BamB/TolA-binding protein
MKMTRALHLALLLASGAAFAQPADEPVPQAFAPDPAAAGPDVFIKDSFEAQELIEKAKRQAERGQYREAGLLLDHVLRDHADKLIARPDGQPGAYEAMPQHVHRLISSWPPEGLAQYRGAVENEARTRLGALRERPRVEDLLALLERYFCTASGTRIGIRAAELAIESGDFALAARVYDQLRTMHPDRRSLSADLSARLALVYALWGKPQRAQACLSEAGAGAADVVVRWMGEPRPIGALLSTLRPATNLSANGGAGAGWPLFGGNNQRNRAAPPMVDQVTLLWQLDDFDTDASERKSAERSVVQQRALDQGRMLGMHPVVGAELIFAQDAATVWAVHLQSGKPAWTRSVHAADERRSGGDLAVAPWHAPTLAGSRLLACMGGDEQTYFGSGPANDAVVLLCLDAASGDEIWRTDRAKLGPSSEELYFDSSPIVAQGLVLTVVRRRRSFGFEDAYAYAFDADTGRVVWQTHIGSASAGGFGYRRATLSIPALHEDTLYVNSNLGGVAAIWTATGRVRWLRLYSRQSEAQWRVSGRGSSREIVPWEYNPVICTDEHIVAAPLDAAAVLVFDRESGDPLGEIPLEALANAQTLLGVADDRLYGVGDAAFCWDLKAGQMAWATPVPGGPALGRGLLTAEAVLVPTRTALVMLDRKDGAAKLQPWAPGTAGGTTFGGGNLLTTPEQLIVAGYERLSVYARKQDVWQRLRERMAQAPRDPVPALDLAEIAMRSGDPQEAVASLTEAVDRAGGFAEPLEPELKRRLFDDCLSFAELLMAGRATDTEKSPASAPAEATGALIDKLLEFASQCPPDPAAHVRYRLRFAGMYERLNRPETAVRLYQQILSDASLRELPVASVRPTGRERAEQLPLPAAAAADALHGGEHAAPAGTVADARIGELIDRFGRTAYAVFDAEAAARLNSLKLAGDAAGLEQLATAYPRATSAPAALQARGQILRERNDPLGAARVLASILGRYRAQIDAPDLMRQIAEAYLAAGRSEDAWAWLSKAAREYPDARVAPASPQAREAGQITFAEYRDRLGDVRARVEPALPKLTLPLDQHQERGSDHAMTLLEPVFDSVPQALWRDYYVVSDGSVQAFHAASGAPVWQNAAPCGTQPLLLLTTSAAVAEGSDGEHEAFAEPARGARTPGRVVLSTRFQIIGLDAASGAPVWTVGEVPADAAGPLADHENFSLFQAFGYAEGRLVAARSDGLVTCVEVESGRQIWQQNPPHAGRPGLPIAVNYAWVVYPRATPGSGAAGLAVLDSETGRTTRIIEMDDDRQIERLFLTLAGQVVVVTVHSITAFEPRTGQRLWSYAPADQNLSPATAEPDLDGLYIHVGQANRRELAAANHIRKISFDDGRTLWASEPLAPRSEEGMTTTLVSAGGGQLLVTGGRFIVALDAVDGRTLWEGTVDKDALYRRRFVTDDYIVAIHEPPERRGGPSTAYFYDYRRRGGAIPAKVGVIDLGELTDVQLVTVRDDALLVQSGKTIHAWTHGP